MSFRQKLLVAMVGTVVLTVVAVAAGVSIMARNAFEREERGRSDALAAQFRREFERSGSDVIRQVEAITNSDAARRMALDLARPDANAGAYIGQAEQIAAPYQLDFLDFVAADGAIISSAEFPARFGYKDEWQNRLTELSRGGAALRRQELPNGSALGIFAVRAVRGSDRPLYVIGGRQTDREFLQSLSLPAGTRAILYSNSGQAPTAADFAQTGGDQLDASKLLPLVAKVQQSGQEADQNISWGSDSTASDTVHAIPLKGAAAEPLGVLLVATSRAELMSLEQQIRSVALAVAALGVLLAILVSGWIAARVTRPVEQLAAGAAAIAAGDWSSRVRVDSRDELGHLAEDFNHMTEQLVAQRDRVIQAERVAAWRELARRLAHELKNPLFPLQITVENLIRARKLPAREFGEVFEESTATLLAEVANLKTIIGRFSDFSKMPKPQFQPVQLNEVVEQVMRLLEPQLNSEGCPRIELRLELDRALPLIAADRELLHRALSNLVLNAQDAMREGGTLTIHTAAGDGAAKIQVSDTGIGMTEEERSRLFTPYYTTKQYGTGLGLAIVQSVVSDHGGKISVASAPGRGTTFTIELPMRTSSMQSTEPLIAAHMERS